MSRQRPSVSQRAVGVVEPVLVDRRRTGSPTAATAVPLPPLSSPSTSTHLPPGPTTGPPPLTENFCAACRCSPRSAAGCRWPCCRSGESRQRPDCGLSSEPSACWTHFWPPTPLQSHSSTLVPAGGAVAVDVQAAADGAQRAVGVVRPVLVLGVASGSPTAAPAVPLTPVSSAATSTHWPPGPVIVPCGAVGHVGLAGVADRDDVGLHRVLGGVARVAGDHHALEERAHVPVAVVAAGAQDDAALLVHRLVAACGRQRPVPPGRQAAGLGVAALERVRGLPVVLQHGGDERRCCCRGWRCWSRWRPGTCRSPCRPRPRGRIRCTAAK